MTRSWLGPPSWTELQLIRNTSPLPRGCTLAFDAVEQIATIRAASAMEDNRPSAIHQGGRIRLPLYVLYQREHAARPIARSRTTAAVAGRGNINRHAFQHPIG